MQSARVFESVRLLGQPSSPPQCDHQLCACLDFYDINQYAVFGIIEKSQSGLLVSLLGEQSHHKISHEIGVPTD